MKTWVSINGYKWYPIHSWMVKKSWYFMDIHECKWMRTGGTPTLGNLHIYIYIYICLFIDMGSSRQRSSWFIMSFHWIFVAKQQTTYRTRIDPANDLPQHDLASHLSLWLFKNPTYYKYVPRCYRNMYNYKYMYKYINIYIQTSVVMQLHQHL